MLKDIFKKTLDREAKSVYTLDGIVSVLFRRNTDKNSATNHMTIFYKADSSLHAGQTIIFEGERYLLLNQETPENTVYQKSDIVLCDTSCVIPLENVDINLSAVLIDSNKISLTQTSTGNFLKGSLELLTSPSAEVEKLSKTGDYRLITNNDIYKIIGKYVDNSILHIEFEQINETVAYNVSITGNVILKPNGTTQLSLQKTAGYNGKTYPLKTLDAVFTSDNPRVLDITPEGIATALTAGTATVTATFQGRAYTISVAAQDALKQVHFEPSIADERGVTLTKINTPMTLKMRLIEPSGESVTAVAEFSVLNKDYRVTNADFTLVGNEDFAVFTRKTWWDFFDIFIKVQAKITYQNTEYVHVWDIRASESYM